MDFSDAASQWLVGAPIAVQMLVLVLVGLPVLAAVAWGLMWVIDATVRVITRPTGADSAGGADVSAGERAAGQAAAGRAGRPRGRGTRIVNHVEPK